MVSCTSVLTDGQWALIQPLLPSSIGPPGAPIPGLGRLNVPGGCKENALRSMPSIRNRTGHHGLPGPLKARLIKSSGRRIFEVATTSKELDTATKLPDSA